jgi:hypothetical protein
MKPDFFVIPRIVQEHPDLRPTDPIVYATVYWYEHLKDGKCTASNAAIARVCGLEDRTVRAALERLEAAAFIERTYKDEARKVRSGIRTLVRFERVGAGEPTPQEVGTGEPRVGTGEPTKVGTGVPQNKSKRVIRKSNSLAARDAAEEKPADPINQLIELFEPLNPSYERLYPMTTQRKALERLVKKHGMDKTAGAIRFAAEVHGEQYCPTITTPLQLESKLGELSACYKRRETGSRSKAVDLSTA